MKKHLPWCGMMVFLCLFIERVRGVRIKKLHVPEIAKPGRPVILDCDYSWEEQTDMDLVVKWFFNRKDIPVYQWIVTKQPQVLGILKGRLNLNYSITQEKNSKHRALQITEPGPDLSGDYTCSVSSFNNEDSQTKSMLVFVPEKKLELHQQYLGENTSRVVCSAEGVFPRPDMNLLVGNSEVNGSIVTIEQRNGLYDIRAKADIPRLVVPEEFSCELSIPRANYTVRKEAVYYPNSGVFAHVHWTCAIIIFVLIAEY